VSSWKVAGSKWFDRSVRSLAVILVIPWIVLVFFIPLTTIALVFIPGRHHVTFAWSALILAILITMVLQGSHIRNLIVDELKDHEMTFREYVKFLRDSKNQEKAQRAEKRARADKLYQMAIFQRKKRAGTTLDARLREGIAVSGGTPGRQIGLIPQFSWNRKVKFATVGTAQILAIGLLVGSLFFWAEWQMVAIPVVLWIIGMFLAGMIPIDTQESPAIIFVAPFLGIFEFMLVAMVLDLFPWLSPPGDYLFYSIVLSMVYLFFMGLPSFFLILIGRTVHDSILTRDLLPRNIMRTLVLTAGVSIEGILILARFGIQFPNEDPLIGMVDFMAIGALTIALTAPEVHRRERQIASMITPILSTVFIVLWGLIDPIYVVIAPIIGILLAFLVTLAAEGDISRKKIRFYSCAKTTLLILFLVGTIYYVGISFLQLFFIILWILGVGVVIAFIFQPEKEELLVISLVSMYLFVGLISIDFLPTHNELSQNGVGWLSLALFITLLFSMRLGLRIHEEYVFNALDGHRLSSKGELAVDEWLSKNSVDHEVHPLLIDPKLGEIQLSFKIPNEIPIYVQVWRDIRKEKNLQHYQQTSAAIKRLQINVVELHPSEANLEQLEAFLGHIKG
jgi:hypothetical protein